MGDWLSTNTSLHARLSKIVLLEKIRWMFGGGDGAERDRKSLFHLFTHIGFWHSSWPLYDMQTTMFLQRSVITLIEWRWQVASGLPVDRNPMLGWSTHTPSLSHTCTPSKLSTQDYLPLNCHLRPSACVKVIDTEHILFTWGGGESPDQRKVKEV